jgi:benzoylformate decarboxylase
MPTDTQATAARALLATLKANDIDTIFGLPGSTEAPLLEALRADGSFRYVLTLQETVTVAMADGYARASGRVGFAGLHTTVGTMNGLSQIYNAARDGSPVVVTAGHKDAGVQAQDAFCALQDLPGLARGFVKHAWQSLTPEAAATDLRRAINIAAAPPAGPVYLALPEDVQSGAVPPVDDASLRAYALTAQARLGRRPDAGAVAAAAALLRSARRPILVLGADAADHRAAARALAEAFELPVFAIERTQLSRLPYPVCDPRYLGQYGEERALIADADVVLLIGARAFMPFSSDAITQLPAGAQLIHAIDAAEFVGWTNAPAVGMSGDTPAVLEDLRAALDAAGGLPADVRAERIAVLGDLRARYAEANARDRDRHAKLAADAGAISLVALTDALGAELPAGAIVIDEAISSSRALLRHTAFPDDVLLHKTNGGSLGWGLPAAVGAKIACPDRTVVAVIGDGSFHFTPQALWTATRERAPIVAIVVDNSGYLAVKLAIERHLGVAKDERDHPGTQLGIDHATVARGYGADVTTIGAAAELAPALRAAFASQRSTVIVVPVPNVRK